LGIPPAAIHDVSDPHRPGEYSQVSHPVSAPVFRTFGRDGWLGKKHYQDGAKIDGRQPKAGAALGEQNLAYSFPGAIRKRILLAFTAASEVSSN